MSIEEFKNIVVGDVDAHTISLEARLRSAQLTGDLKELDKLISDDLLFSGPNGLLVTKEQDLDAYKSGSLKFLSHTPEELQARKIGTDVAITTLKARLSVEVSGAIYEGIYRYTRVWARKNDSWQIVGGHVSAI